MRFSTYSPLQTKQRVPLSLDDRPQFETKELKSELAGMLVLLLRCDGTGNLYRVSPESQALVMSHRALTELLRGKGAHADPIACLEDISADIAGRQVAGFPHSIAQLVFHMNYWMSYELRRIRGERPAYPEHNSESFPAAAPVDVGEWERLRWDLAWFLAQYMELAKSTAAELQREIESVHEGDEKVAGTLEAVLWQMVVHNSYHVGQIALIRRALGAWPPRAGGDTW